MQNKNLKGRQKNIRLRKLLVGKKQKSQKNALAENLSQKFLILFIEFFFSVAFIGGGSYLLFQADSDLLKVSRKMIEAREEDIETNALSDVMLLLRTSWYFKDEPNKEKNWQVLYNTLREKKGLPRLDPILVEDSINWCHEAISNLTSERGSIGGFVFKNEIYKAFIADVQKEYDNNIQLVKELKEAFINWQDENSSARAFRLKSIYKIGALDRVETGGSIISKLSQMLSINKIKIAKSEQLIRETNNEIEIIARKKTFSILGIIIGFVLLIIFASYFLYTFREPLSK